MKVKKIFNKKLIFLMVILSLFFMLIISNVKANNIHYNYTFESVDLNLEPKFNRTSNLRQKQEFHTGVFLSQYSFTNLSGVDINDLDFFDVVNKDKYCKGIITDLDGHNGVLEIRDYNTSGILNASHNFGAYDNLVISYWIRSVDVSEIFNINLKLNLTEKVLIRIYNDVFQYKDLLNAWNNIPNSDIYDNTWIHIKTVFDCTVDTFDFYLDGNLIGNDLEFNEITNSLNKLCFITDMNGINQIFIDAIDIVDGLVYNHSNVEILKTDTNLYEVDKYDFHQDGIDNRAPKSGGTGGDEFGWDVSGNIVRSTGHFENPETGVVDSDNVYLNFYANYVGSIYLTRNFPIYTDSEIEIYFEFKLISYPELSTFGMYIQDSATNTILSIVANTVAGEIKYRITNGVDYIIVAHLEVGDLLKVRTVYNTEYKVFKIYTEHFDNSLIETFYYHNIYNTFIGTDFYNIKFNEYSSTDTLSSVGLDNIGIYLNGSSLNEDMFGYAEVLYESFEHLESSILFEGYSHVGTTYPINFFNGYIIDDDDLDELYSLGLHTESLDLSLCKDSLIFTLDAYSHTGKTIELIGFQDFLKLVENNDTYYNGVIEKGSDTSIYSKYDVINSRLEGYLESEGLTNEWISIEFDIDDFLTTNYSFIINEMYKTNWLFNTEFTLTFTDNTQFKFVMDSSTPFDIIGNQFESNFGSILSNYKYIDTFKFNISNSDVSQSTSILAGIKSMKLHRNELGFIDLEDLHDSGILAVMIPFFLLLFPTFFITSISESKKKGSGKKVFIPVFLFISTIMFASGIIPTWIYFIIVLGFGALLILKKRLSHD